MLTSAHVFLVERTLGYVPLERVRDIVARMPFKDKDVSLSV